MRPAGGGEDTPPGTEAGPTSGFWVHAADLVVRHPAAILVVCLGALLPLAIAGAQAKPNYNQLADLDGDRPSVIGAAVVRRHFAVGELSPATILVDDPALDFRSEPGRSAIADVSRRLRAVDNVAEVRSLTQPAGKPLGGEGKNFLTRLADEALRRGAESRYVSVKPADPADRGHITRLDIVFQTDPFSEASLNGLERVRQVLQEAAASGQPLEGTRSIGVAGSTSMVNDLRRVTVSDLRRMYMLITLGVYAILVLLLRRPGIGLYLVATVVLGYLASLGLTDLLFRALHRGPTPWGGLDWTVSFFLFVILVAVGEDYNIFLMARVVEEERKYGAIEGTRRAVAHTGGIISSCGLIMAGTFGAMLTGKLASLRELGFSLGMGVLLDTFLVRPILVPAFLVLVDRAARDGPAPRTGTPTRRSSRRRATATPAGTAGSRPRTSDRGWQREMPSETRGERASDRGHGSGEPSVADGAFPVVVEGVVVEGVLAGRVQDSPAPVVVEPAPGDGVARDPAQEHAVGRVAVHLVVRDGVAGRAGVFDLDAVVAVVLDGIETIVRAADRVVGRPGVDRDAVEGVTQGIQHRVVGADVVALDPVVARAGAGDQARRRSRSPRSRCGWPRSLRRRWCWTTPRP